MLGFGGGSMPRGFVGGTMVSFADLTCCWIAVSVYQLETREPSSPLHRSHHSRSGYCDNPQLLPIIH